ncbi:hypothetical protein F5Y07DRAFT_403128 [Xylaria sp. FL0933]|nr:hypothetical protein F5Y07DRAFT_403128 [Xylaria sp. FL0933]
MSSGEASCPTARQVGEIMEKAAGFAAYADTLLSEVVRNRETGESSEQSLIELQVMHEQIASFGRDLRDILLRLDSSSYKVLENDEMVCANVHDLFGWQVADLQPLRTCTAHQ